MSDATQQGVSEEVVQTAEATGTTPEKKLEPTARERDMEAIAVQRQEGFDAEVKTTAPAAEPAKDQVPDQLTAQTAEPTVLPDDALDKFKVKTKVLGVEGEVSVAEMRRSHQTVAAANKIMEDAKRERTELERQRAEFEAQKGVGRDTKETTSQTTDQPLPTGADRKAKAKEFLHTLLNDGDEDKALQALEQILPGETPTREVQQIDPNAVAAQVRQQLVVESALEQSQKDYPQLYADPDIEALGATKIRRKQEEGMTFTEALADVGAELAEKFGWQKPGRPEATSPTTERTEKLERKAGIDVIPALNTKATTADVPEPTASDVIKEMRKARGMEV